MIHTLMTYIIVLSVRKAASRDFSQKEDNGQQQQYGICNVTL